MVSYDVCHTIFPQLSQVVDGDLDESIKRSASDRLGDLVPQVRARTSPGVFRDMALLGLCLELSFSILYCRTQANLPTISSLLYIYHVRPIFEYASPLWHGAISAELALSFEKLQASVSRAILRAPWRTPKQQLLKALNWPSLCWRRAIASTCLFQQLIHAPNTLPSLSKHLSPLLSSRSTRNRRKPFQIALPKVRTTRYQHSFFFLTALLWNNLPQSIQTTKPPQQFRIALEQLWHKYKHNPTTDIPLPF